MNTKNGKANGSNKFIYQFTDKLDLKTLNIGLVNLSIHYTGETLNLNATTMNLKFQLRLGIMNLICLMLLFQFLKFKITLNLSSKNTKC